jgi:beta-1,4-mannosyl-glycoprotein beta-1,4-N-acetylglucosaminyltransferase
MTSRVFDCFLFFNEVDLLECRLEELSGVVDKFIIVEAGENHQGKKRRSRFDKARFAPWGRQIEYIWVPSLKETLPRKKENEQREWFGAGLASVSARPSDIVIQSDLDEIPTRASVLGLEASLEACLGPIIAFDQSPHYFAVDWKHPRRCGMAPAACRLSDVTTFTEMRHASEGSPTISNAGWHFSWLGTPAEHVEKLNGIYEGPGIYQNTVMDLVTGKNWREGIHVDGVQMAPIDINDTFPAFIRERRCPPYWFRPRI